MWIAPTDQRFFCALMSVPGSAARSVLAVLIWPALVATTVLMTGCASNGGVADSAERPGKVAVGERTALSGDRELPAMFNEGRVILPATIRTTPEATWLAATDDQTLTARQRYEATGDLSWRQRVAEGLYARSRVLGTSADLEAAIVENEAVLAEAPDMAGALLLAAKLDAGLHRFVEARAHLKAAEKAGAKAARVSALEREIALATGEIFPEPSPPDEAPVPQTLYGLADVANDRAAVGRLDEAERLFSKAQFVELDSSPFPFAWLHTQHGIALLNAGQNERANLYFRAAHERLPRYYLATEHLAETEALLGRTDSARKLYREVIDATGNPEFIGALARVETQAGNTQAAKALREQARSAWLTWVDRHPEAYWDHAAAFFLESDRAADQAKGLDFARRNRVLRADLTARLLLAQAEAKAGSRTEACAAWLDAMAVPGDPPARHTLAAEFADCGEKLPR